MSSMMAPPKQECMADSGYGCRVSIFRRPRRLYAIQLDEERKRNDHGITALTQAEQEGDITMAFATSDKAPAKLTGLPRMKTFCRETHTFFLDLDKFLKSTRAQYIDQLAVTTSLGSITLTLAYREAPSQEESVGA